METNGFICIQIYIFNKLFVEIRLKLETMRSQNDVIERASFDDGEFSRKTTYARNLNEGLLRQTQIRGTNVLL